MNNIETIPQNDLDGGHMFPLDSVGQIHQLEQKLNNSDYKAQLYNHLRKIVGTGSYWKSSCYKLCGVLFTK